MSNKKLDKVILIVPNTKVSRRFEECFIRIASLMGACQRMSDFLAEQDEELPEEALQKMIGPELLQWVKKIMEIYPHGQAQMLQDCEAIQSMIDNRHVQNNPNTN